MEKKYKLVPATNEESEAFGNDFKEFLAKYPNKSITLGINKEMVNIKMEDGTMKQLFADSPTMLIHNKVEIVEPEIVSDNPEVNPTLPQDENPTTTS